MSTFSGTQLERKTTAGCSVMEVNVQLSASSVLCPAVIFKTLGETSSHLDVMN
jgi:hypothetical protein